MFTYHWSLMGDKAAAASRPFGGFVGRRPSHWEVRTPIASSYLGNEGMKGDKVATAAKRSGRETYEGRQGGSGSQEQPSIEIRKGDKWRETRRQRHHDHLAILGDQQPGHWEVRTPIASSYLGKKHRHPPEHLPNRKNSAAPRAKRQKWFQGSVRLHCQCAAWLVPRTLTQFIDPCRQLPTITCQICNFHTPKNVYLRWYLCDVFGHIDPYRPTCAYAFIFTHRRIQIHKMWDTSYKIHKLQKTQNVDARIYNI